MGFERATAVTTTRQIRLRRAVIRLYSPVGVVVSCAHLPSLWTPNWTPSRGPQVPARYVMPPEGDSAIQGSQRSSTMRCVLPGVRTSCRRALSTWPGTSGRHRLERTGTVGARAARPERRHAARRPCLALLHSEPEAGHVPHQTRDRTGSRMRATGDARRPAPDPRQAVPSRRRGVAAGQDRRCPFGSLSARCGRPRRDAFASS
jgi:hypothetical protein